MPRSAEADVLEFKIIIVEPRYQINLGYIARVSKNFGVKKLFMVKPRVRIGARAIMFSKHASDLLKHARIYPDLDSAIKNCDLVVGTTGVWRKAKVNFKRVYTAEQVAERLSEARGGRRAAILIGRDDIGLTSDEIAKCDMVACIPSNPEYPVLNISHALGIILYLLTEKGFRPALNDSNAGRADRKELGYLMELFDGLIEKKRIRNKKAVKNVFRRLVYVSQPNRQEIHALITALK